MTPQEKNINDIAEAGIEKFRPFASKTSAGFWSPNQDYYLISAIKCAIECQREVIKQLESCITVYTFEHELHDELTEAQQVLENLQKRLL